MKEGLQEALWILLELRLARKQASCYGSSVCFPFGFTLNSTLQTSRACTLSSHLVQSVACERLAPRHGPHLAFRILDMFPRYRTQNVILVHIGEVGHSRVSGSVSGRCQWETGLRLCKVAHARSWCAAAISGGEPQGIDCHTGTNFVS